MATPAESVKALVDAEKATLDDALTKLNAATTDEEKEAASKAYNEAFAQRSKAIEAGLADKAVANSTADADAAEAETKRLEDEKAQLEEQLKALEADAKAEESIASTPAKPYLDFLVARGNLSASIATLRSTMTGIVNEGAFQMYDSRTEPQQLVDDWQATFDGIEKDLLDVTSRVDSLNTDASKKLATDVDVDAVTKDWAATKDMIDTVREKVADDKNRRTTADESLQDFDKERKSLLLWCRQQKTNLDAMVEPDHVQEFCASLLNNFKSMEENFTVLLDFAEPLLPNLDVQNGLLELNEVWLNLQISAYERLRHTLLEIHPKSRLEDEVRAFSTYSSRSGEFLDEFMRLLAVPSDAESQSAVKPVVEECERLREAFAAHANLSEHLREFALRMECFRDSYNNLRRAVFGKLTFLSNSVPSLATSMRRKEEYISRMKDLKKWVDTKSQGETWADIHTRMLKIRDLIDEEQKLLAQNTSNEKTE